jgi:hypothetical protein
VGQLSATLRRQLQRTYFVGERKAGHRPGTAPKAWSAVVASLYRPISKTSSNLEFAAWIQRGCIGLFALSSAIAELAPALGCSLSAASASWSYLG